MRVVIPNQLNRIVSPVNALGGAADQHTVAWAEQHRLVTTRIARRRLAATRPGALAAHCYPSASAYDLFLLADWMTWLFNLEDENDEGSYGRNPQALEPVLTNLLFAAIRSDYEVAKHPSAAALTDIFERIGDRMSASWRYRFVHHIIDYFTANVWQAAHRRTGDIPDLDTFFGMRRDAGAVMPSFDLIEFVVATTIPAEVYYSRVYQRLLTSAANVVCWTNDLMTLEKKLAHDDNHNLVPVLGHALAISLEDSVDDVAAKAGREIEHYLAAEAELNQLFDRLAVSDELRATTRDCVEMLRAWMRGHVEWGRDTARYQETSS